MGKGRYTMCEFFRRVLILYMVEWAFIGAVTLTGGAMGRRCILIVESWVGGTGGRLWAIFWSICKFMRVSVVFYPLSIKYLNKKKTCYLLSNKYFKLWYSAVLGKDCTHCTCPVLLVSVSLIISCTSASVGLWPLNICHCNRMRRRKKMYKFILVLLVCYITVDFETVA